MRFLFLLLSLFLLHLNKFDKTDDATVSNKQAPAKLPYMPTGFYHLTNTADGVKMTLRGTLQKYNVAPVAFASVKDIVSATLEKPKPGSGYNTDLVMIFNVKGARNLKDGTGNPAHPKLAVIVANRLLYVVDNNAKITGGVMYVALQDYSEKEMINLKNAVEHKR